MSSACELFGPELRQRRTEAGLSLSALAQQLHYSKGYISKIENGVKPPTEQFAQLCDRALDAGGTLVHLCRRRRAERTLAPIPDHALVEGLGDLLLQKAASGPGKVHSAGARKVIVGGAICLFVVTIRNLETLVVVARTAARPTRRAARATKRAARRMRRS